LKLTEQNHVILASHRFLFSSNIDSLTNSVKVRRHVITVIISFSISGYELSKEHKLRRIQIYVFRVPLRDNKECSRKKTDVSGFEIAACFSPFYHSGNPPPPHPSLTLQTPAPVVPTNGIHSY
jgi:hypothetical protein